LAGVLIQLSSAAVRCIVRPKESIPTFLHCIDTEMGEFKLETCMGNFPRECRGKYRGYGDKISDNPAGWDGNLIAENPMVAVGRIAS